MREVANDHTERAARLIETNFVLDGTQVFRTGGPGKPRLPLGDVPLDDSLIDEWHAEGLNAFIHPFAVLATDMHLGQLQTLGRWNAFIADHSESLQRIDRPSDFDRVRATGKLGILLGTHHGEPFRNVDDVDYFAGLGLRSCIPVTFGQNRLGAAVDEPAGGGLTGFGRAVVARMNKVGMAVDVSHCNERTRLDAIDVSAKPVLMSHANAYTRCANVRNATDAVIKALAARGGVMGIMPLRMMLTTQEPTTLDDFIDHIAYVADLVGPRHVGMGLETPPEGFDSIPGANQIPLPSYMRNEGVQRKLDLPELCHLRRLYTIVEALLRRGFDDTAIAGIIGGNFERVLREILTV